MRTMEVGASLAPRACGSGVACGNIAWKSWQF
jgi:diaminopimelate epimerase